MSKPYKTLDEQTEHLRNTKNIRFDDAESAKIFLLENNYYNVISCSKIIICDSIEAGKHKYPVTNFQLWRDYYTLETKISRKILEILLDIDKKLNSRLAYYLSTIIEKENLSNEERFMIKECFKGIKESGWKNYCFQDTWAFVARLTMGATVKLIETIIEINRFRTRNNLNKYIFNILGTYSLKSLKELCSLRNKISHNTPLSVYLTSIRISKRMNRQKVLQIFSARKSAVWHCINLSDLRTDEIAFFYLLFNRTERYIINKFC